MDSMTTIVDLSVTIGRGGVIIKKVNNGIIAMNMAWAPLRGRDREKKEEERKEEANDSK